VNIVIPTDTVGRDGTPIPTALHTVEVVRGEDLDHLSGATNHTQWHAVAPWRTRGRTEQAGSPRRRYFVGARVFVGEQRRPGT